MILFFNIIDCDAETACNFYKKNNDLIGMIVHSGVTSTSNKPSNKSISQYDIDWETLNSNQYHNIILLF